MKSSRGMTTFAGGLCLATMALTASGAWAQSSGTASSGAPSYDRLKKSLKVDGRVSLAQVRADMPANLGRVIEVRGAVSGLMSTAAGRTAILQTDGTTLVFLMPSRVPGSEVVRAGASIRALLVVGQDETTRRMTFTPAAIALDAQPAQSSQPSQPPVVAIPSGRTAANGSSIGGTPASGATVVPPMTTMRGAPSVQWVPPQPPPAQPPAIVASRPGIDPNTAGDDSMEAQIPAYVRLARRYNKKLTAAQAVEIGTAVVQAGHANGMDPRFLAAIIAVESDFDIYCRSSSGAMGLGQLMPFNLPEARIRDPWNPTQNIWGTARLLRGHLNDYRNRSDGTLLAVAAYNAGPGAVRRAGYRVPNGAQVQRYVRKVYNRYKEFAPDMFK